MQNIGALGIGIVVLVMILAVTFGVMAQLRTQTVNLGEVCAQGNATWNATTSQCCEIGAVNTAYCGGANLSRSYSNAWNTSLTLTNATQTIPGWVPLIILVAIGGIILSLVAVFNKR